jgi:hypothetical protein
MPVPMSTIPAVGQIIDVWAAPLCAAPIQLTGNVTLTAPTSATLVTGLTTLVAIPALATYLRVQVSGADATVTAAATITISLYSGATSGTLTTLIADSVVVAPTGGTTVAVNSTFYVPVTNALAGTSATYLSIAATASTGNFVLNAGATTPTTFIIDCL